LPIYIFSATSLKADNCACTSASVDSPGVIPHQQGKLQLELFSRKSRAIEYALSAGRVSAGADVGVRIFAGVSSVEITEVVAVGTFAIVEAGDGVDGLFDKQLVKIKIVPVANSAYKVSFFDFKCSSGLNYS
jgi:hypothetical protein